MGSWAGKRVGLRVSFRTLTDGDSNIFNMWFISQFDANIQMAQEVEYMEVIWELKKKTTQPD